MSKFLIHLKIVGENNFFSVLVFLLFRLFRSKRIFAARIGGAPLKLRASGPDFKVARRCLIEGEFDSLKPLLEDRDIAFIIDGGGYIGTAAIAFARMFPKATIISVEPFEENYALLKQNVAPWTNIIPLQAALVGSDRLVNLHDRATGDWGLTIAPHVGDQALTALQGVNGVSIPTLLDQHGVERLDILKLDVEGAEKEILETAQSWLPSTQAILAETHDRIVPGCTDAFDQATGSMHRVPMDGEKSLAIRAQRPQ